MERAVSHLPGRSVIPDDLLIDASKLRVTKRVLGKGGFATVLKARLKLSPSRRVDVAFKKLTMEDLGEELN